MGINDILAAIDNMKRVGGRNIRDLGRDPMGALSKIAHNVKEQLGTEEGTKEFMYNSMTPGVGGIIKAKGGNWLTGSVENALSGLKKRVRTEGINGHTAGNVAQDTALNNWIEGPLTKYVKRDMATEGDPVRKLAEQGILHMVPGYIPEGTEAILRGDAAGNRLRASQDLSGLGVSPQAQLWESMSDASVVPGSAKSRMQYHSEANPWLKNLQPEDLVHHYSNRTGELGLPHLTDELSNALNPESGLPRHLQLTPEQMQQMGMEKAVRHVADINAWRAAEAKNAKLSSLKNASTLREYPEGYKWVTIPDTSTKEGMELAKSLGCESGWCTQGDSAARKYGSNGGKLHVLIDPEGKAVSQIATEPGKLVDKGLKGDAAWERLYEDLMDNYPDLYNQLNKSDVRVEKLLQENNLPLYNKYFSESSPPNIVEIKGRFNKKPDDVHIPFVQDFVRNHPEGGKWGDVGDFGNTGLERLSDYQEAVQQAARTKHPEQMYFTAEELQPFVDAQFAEPKKFAEGGVVQAEPQWQPLGTGYILR